MIRRSPLTRLILLTLLLGVFLGACDDAEDPGPEAQVETAEDTVEVEPAAVAELEQTADAFLEALTLGYGADAAELLGPAVAQAEREAFARAVDSGELLLVSTQELDGPRFSEQDGVLTAMVEYDCTVMNGDEGLLGVETLEFARTAAGWRLTAVPFTD